MRSAPLAGLAGAPRCNGDRRQRTVRRCHAVAGRPGAPAGGCGLALYYLGLAVMLSRRHVVVRLAGLMAIVVGGATHRHGYSARHAAPGLRLTMLDVGQGDGIVLQNGRRTLMVDTGGSPFGGGGFDIGSRVVEPALWARGVSSLRTFF